MKNDINNKIILNGISWILSEKLLTEIVESIIAIFLARLLIPKDYGLVALIQIFINVSSAIVEGGLGKSLVQDKNSDECMMSTIFFINLFIGIIIYLLLFAIAPYVASTKESVILCPLLRVMAIKIPLASIYNIQHAYVQKKLKFKTFFFSSLFGTLLSGVIGIGLAFLGYGPWALVFANLTDQIADIVILFLSTKWYPKRLFSIKKTHKIIRYGFNLLFIDIVSQLYSQLRSIVIGAKYNSIDLAYDQKGVKFPHIFSNLIDAVTVKVIFPVLASLNDNKAKVKEISRYSIKYSTYFFAPMIIGLAAVANNAVSIILTDKWIGCVPYMQLYCLTYLTHTISAVDTRTVEASGEGKILSKMIISERVIGISSIIIAVFLFDNAIAIAASMLIAQLIYVVIESISVNKIINYSLIEHIEDIIQPVLFSLSMGVLVYFIGKKLTLSKVFVLLIQVFTGAFYYLLVSILFKNESFYFFYGKIKTLFSKK